MLIYGMLRYFVSLQSTALIMVILTILGFLMPKEQLTLESVRTTNNKYFVPFIWASSVVAKARKEGMIKSDIAVQKLLSVNDLLTGWLVD